MMNTFAAKLRLR